MITNVLPPFFMVHSVVVHYRPIKCVNQIRHRSLLLHVT